MVGKAPDTAASQCHPSSAHHDCETRCPSGNAQSGERPREPLSSRSPTNFLNGQRPRPHMHRRGKQEDSKDKQQTWQEVGRGATPCPPAGEAQAGKETCMLV